MLELVSARLGTVVVERRGTRLVDFLVDGTNEVGHDMTLVRRRWRTTRHAALARLVSLRGRFLELGAAGLLAAAGLEVGFLGTMTLRRKMQTSVPSWL